jgi:transglutaminase-like putative cysteine protease
METTQERSFSFRELRRQIASLPQPKTEESITLRILVQLLVAVGIIATDVAAYTTLSFWAVPLTFLGGIWSWYRRRERNIFMKFLIAIGMLLALGNFFGNLIQNLNDTRLVLAQLLIQLQVLHSFDLPRRKDLGYSMVIALILIGVAGTVSQTIVFAPFLLAFLALALPILILDYRSRLNLDSSSLFPRWVRKKGLVSASSSKYSPLSPRRLSGVLAIIVVLGLGIFIAMPRVPGYQLQSFPVSAPGDLSSQLLDGEDTGRISNPGYVNPGEEGGGGDDTGRSPTEGKGTVNPIHYSGFNSQMNQNLRGEMQPQIVLRVRSQAPGFWRVVAFDEYTGQGWKISRDNQEQIIERPSWSYRFWFNFPESIGETKDIIQSYTAVTDLPNLIPALSVPERLYYPTEEIIIGPEGDLRSPTGIIVEGLTYTVISEVPLRDRAALAKAGTDYPERITDYYLSVPPDIKEQVRAQAEELLAKSEKPLTAPSEQALYLAQALKQNYSIQPDLPFLEDDEDLVSSFLFKHQGGYPDHFSTTLTIMLRSLGIPARLVTGYAPGQFNPFTGFYVVRNTDAYAMTEVYFPGYGWFPFDPIPGHELVPPSWEESQAFSVLRQFWNWVAGWLPSPITGFISNVWSFTIAVIIKTVSWLWRFFSGSVIGWLAGAITLVVLSFLGWLGWQQGKNWQRRRRLAKLPPMERLYYQMVAQLTAKGYPKHPAQTPREFVQGVTPHLSPEVLTLVDEISQAYVDWRYGQRSPNIPHLRQQLQGLRKQLSVRKKELVERR